MSVVSSCGGAYDRGDAGEGSARACQYEGQSHADGESFPASDGCNTCRCDDGTVGCTKIGCTCADILERWSAALQQAKQCTPSDPNTCLTSVPGELPCGCETFVSGTQRDAIDDMELAQRRLHDLTCFGPIACEPCAPPTSGICTGEGVCTDVW